MINFFRTLRKLASDASGLSRLRRPRIPLAAAWAILGCLFVVTGSPLPGYAQPGPTQFATADLGGSMSTDLNSTTAKRSPEPFLGSFSCGSTTCHGSPRRESTIGSASHFFLDQDPHQSGGIVLRQQRSQDIARRLNLPTPAWESKECLGCHAPGATSASTDRTHFSSMITEGVGCESCHGSARNWLTAHHTSDWKRPEIWSNSRKAQAGFRELKSLPSRIDACADCHVGNEDQFVSHDLVAAGHPRLAFEYSAYQSRMPVHWKRADDRLRTPVGGRMPSSEQSTYEATNWLVGQFINAKHELSILTRAASDSHSVFPELAQYDCFACHHRLDSPNWRDQRQANDLKIGTLPWGSWNLGLLSEIQTEIPAVLSDQFSTNQRQLQSMLSKLAADRTLALPLINEMKRELDHALHVLGSSNLTAEQLVAVKDRLLTRKESFTRQGWDQSAQLYLALVALDKGLSDASGRGNRVDPAKQAILERIRDLLAYQPVESPGSPPDYPESPVRLNRNWSSLNDQFVQLKSGDAESKTGERSGGSEGVLIDLMPKAK